MPCAERAVILYARKQRFEGLGAFHRCGISYAVKQRLARENFSMFGGVERRAGRHRVARIFRKDGVRPGKLQRFGKCALKPFAVIERAAEKQDLAADALALRKTRDGLIDDRFINAHGQIVFFAP